MEFTSETDNKKVLSDEDIGDYMLDLFEAPDLVGGDELVKEYLQLIPMNFLNKCDQYEKITLLMKYSNALWFDGIKILLEHGVDINAEDENGLNAFMYVMQSYNNMMEAIMVGCDCRYTLNALNDIKARTNLGEKLDSATINDIMKHTSLRISHGKYYPISDDEYVEIIKSLANRTFDGKFETVEKIVNLFESHGLQYKQKYLLLSFDNTTNMNDGGMHFVGEGLRNYDSTRYLIEKFRDNNIEVDNYLTEDKIHGSHNNELFKKWTSGDINWKHYYVTILEVLE